jgi:hypothetical protein
MDLMQARTLPELHRRLSELDAPDPSPHLVAVAGEIPLGIIRLRPFPPGGVHDPLVEVMALMVPLGADRVSLALPGRAWSLDDPVVPVTDDADLRQRVVLQVTVDGHDHEPPALETLLHPFDVGDDGHLEWQDAIDPGPAQGWVAGALQAMIAARRDLQDCSADQRMAQWNRLEDLEHIVLLTPEGEQRVLLGPP